MIRYAPASLDEFLALCEQCKEVQEHVLLDILKHAEQSQIGEKFGFSKIKNYADFASILPPQTWKDLEPYAKAMERGEKNQLFNGVPDYFVCTSGTTGSIKKIPESARGRAAKSMTTRLRVEAIARHAPSVTNAKLLPLVNNAVEGYSEAGIAFGSASGIALATASEQLKNRVAFPLEALEVGYSDALDYLILRFALEEDVRIIFGNNAGRIEQFFLRAEKEAEHLIDDIKHGTLSCETAIPAPLLERLQRKCTPNPTRAEELRLAWKNKKRFLPEVYWPNLQVVTCWLAGSVGRYVKAIRPFLSPSVLLFDLGYGATEGKFNIPLEPKNPAGTLTTYAAFYEFCPLGETRFLRAHELQDGEEYELYVTNYSGLYRYALRDVVRVDGFSGNTPRILFEYKAGEMLNLAGEKVAAATLLPVVSSVIGSALTHWCVVGDPTQKRYLFCVELSELPENPDQLARNYAQKLETALMEETLIYPIFRNQNLLEKIGLKLMRSGWMDALYADQTQSGRSKVQIKLPLLYPQLPHPEYILTE